MLENVPGRLRIIVEADKGYDTGTFFTAMRDPDVAPHVAQNTTDRRSAVGRRTTRHPG